MHCGYSARHPSLIHISKNFNARRFGDIYDCLPIRSNVHKFKEVTLALIIFCNSVLSCIELNVICKHCFGFETDCSVKFCNLHFAFYVTFERFTEKHVARFRRKQTYVLATERVAVAVIKSTQTHLLLQKHFRLNLHYIRRERIVDVGVVNRIGILMINLEYVRGKQFDIFSNRWNCEAICVCI